MANWFLPVSAERSLRFLDFACYTPSHEKYIHPSALFSGPIVVLALASYFFFIGYLDARYHVFLRSGFSMLFGLLSLGMSL